MRQIPAGWRQLFLLSAEYGILPGRGPAEIGNLPGGRGVLFGFRPVRHDVMGESHAEVYWESTSRDVWKLGGSESGYDGRKLTSFASFFFFKF